MRKLIAGLVLSLGLVGTAVASDVNDFYPNIDPGVLMKLYLHSERETLDGDQIIVVESKIFEELQLTEAEFRQYIPALTEIYDAE